MQAKALLDAGEALLQRLLRFEEPMEAVVADAVRRDRSLGSRDRRWLGDLAYDVVRRLGALRYVAEAVEARLRGRASEPRPHDPRVPSGLARRLVLLAWPADGPPLDDALGADERAFVALAGGVDAAALPAAARRNLPPWLDDRLRSQVGDAELDRFAAAVAVPAPLDLRVNRLKATLAQAVAALAEAGIDVQRTPLSPLGLRVEGKPDLMHTRAWRDGLVEVQDEGSQLLALAVGARRNEVVVDFCAGGGGKTLALGAQMRASGRLYAFDTSGHRLAALGPRAARAGLDDVQTLQLAHEHDARLDRLAGKVDRVLVDAPCTGLGTLRRHPDLAWRHAESERAGRALRQSSILAAASRLLKPGGRLVYATCSVLAEEDEAIAAAFEAGPAGTGFERLPLARVFVGAAVAGVESIVTGDDLRLWPQRHGTDGFYAAAWTRRKSPRP